MAELLARLTQRKLVRWALAYLAAAWAVLQALELAAGSYGWPHRVMQIAIAAVALALPVPAASIPEKSVAVLPFANESGNKDQQFFSDGLSDDLITALSQFADAAAALQTARGITPGTWRDQATAYALQIGPDRAAADAALRRLVDTQAGFAAYQIAEIFALRKNPDALFEWLDRARKNRDGGIIFLLTDPLILRYRNDPRFAAFCRKMGLPVTSDAMAMP